MDFRFIGATLTESPEQSGRLIGSPKDEPQARPLFGAGEASGDQAATRGVEVSPNVNLGVGASEALKGSPRLRDMTFGNVPVR